MKKRIYISVPISNLDEKTQRAKADNIKSALSKQGWEVVNPFDIYVGKDATYEDYICADLRALMDCDAIFMCEGWMESCGCQIEHSVAIQLDAFGRRKIRRIYEGNLSHNGR